MRKKTLKIKFFLLFCSLAGYSTIISAQDKTVKEKNEKDSTIISIPYGSKLKTEFSGASDVISGKVLENVPVQHLSNALSGRISVENRAMTKLPFIYVEYVAMEMAHLY